MENKEKKIKWTSNKEKIQKILKKIGVISAIVIPILALIMYIVSMLLANSSCQRLINYVESGDESSLSLVSTRRETEAYQLMQTLMSMEDPTEYKEESTILSEIYKNTKISKDWVIPAITTAKVNFTIDAPDMYKFIMKNKSSKLSADKLYDLIAEYAASSDTERKITKITLDLKLTKYGWMIDFDNAKFMDAISGGFLSAYSELAYETLI